jgi:hypothetical protein
VLELAIRARILQVGAIFVAIASPENTLFRSETTNPFDDLRRMKKRLLPNLRHDKPNMSRKSKAMKDTTDEPISSPTPTSRSGDSESRPGLAWNRTITRRSFLKRTGGATAATFVSWHAATSNVDAATWIAEGGSGSGDNTPDWRIHSHEIGHALGSSVKPPDGHVIEASFGPLTQTTWGAVNKMIRRKLVLEAYAPRDLPNSPWYTYMATCAVTIRVSEWAEVADVANGEPVGWDDMTESEWNHWYASEYVDKHVTSATLTKMVSNGPDGKPYVEVVSSSVHGGTDSTKSVGGIGITLVWVGDDLNITFSSLGQSIDPNTFTLISQWSLKNFP